MIVAVGGPPGSGKTTVAERFAKAHAYALVSAGAKFRALSEAKGMSLNEFGLAAEADPSIDRALDHAMLEEILKLDATGRDVIVDGRIQAPLLAQRRVPCLKVWIDAKLDVRTGRIAGREKKALKVTRTEIIQREASERRRYKAIYGINLADTSIYDLVIDSSDKTPDEIVALVWSAVEEG